VAFDFRKFFGRAASDAAGFSAGVAVGPVLAPVVQDLRNTANALHPHRPPDAGALALGVAQGQVDRGDAETWASYHGLDGKAFGALVDIANTGPGVPVAFDLWRRGTINEAGFRRAAKRQGLEPEWIDDLVAIFHAVLDPADLARGIHRGLIPDPGLLEGRLPAGVGNVPAYPVYDVDAIAEALAAGFDRDHLGVLVGLQGNPMGAHEAAQASFRHVITEDDYLRAIAEGNTRNEWADAIREQSRAIPSVTNYVEARVRGWLTDAEMKAGAARHGMTSEDAELEFLIHGRPLSWHQVWIGLQRGGTFDGPTANIEPAFLKALQESNIRPEWYNLAWAQRYTYPSAFVLRALVQSGVLTQAEGEADLLDMGWRPDRAKQASAAWAGGGATTADSHVAKAQAQLWAAAHRSYIAEESDDATASAALAEAGVDAAAVAGVLAVWAHERDLIRKQLTPAQIKKAWTKNVVNPATNAAWTRDEALAALIARGYAPNDANTFLEL
jgi:hypothetical protein